LQLCKSSLLVQISVVSRLIDLGLRKNRHKGGFTNLRRGSGGRSGEGKHLELGAIYNQRLSPSSIDALGLVGPSSYQSFFPPALPQESPPIYVTIAIFPQSQCDGKVSLDVSNPRPRTNYSVTTHRRMGP
jgi:hypothetical protein